MSTRRKRPALGCLIVYIVSMVLLNSFSANADLISGLQLSCKINGGLSFDGINDYVQIPGLLGQPQNVTISVWANLNAKDTSGAEVISIGDYAAIRLDDKNGKGAMGFYYDGTTWRGTPTGIMHAGTGWHHFVYVVDDIHNMQKVYIDGVEKGSTAYTQSISYTGLGSRTFLGRHANGSDNYDFNGVIDDVRVYNKVLSAQEVLDLYNQSTVSPTPAPTVLPEITYNYLFQDQVATGWLIGGWNVQSNVQTTVKMTGTSSVFVTSDEWAGFMFEHRSESWDISYVQSSEYTHVSFDINAGSRVAPGIGKLEVSLDVSNSPGQELSKYVTIMQPNTWYHVRVPIKDLNVMAEQYFRVGLYNNSRQTGFSYYIDNMTLEKDGTVVEPTPAPTPAPMSGEPVTFSIDTAVMRQKAISPYVYGVNQIDSTMRVQTFVRAGGNRWTAYNWETNASNAGMDWNNSSDNFLTYGTGVDPKVPGSAAQYRGTQAHNMGAAVLLTVPMVDYVAANQTDGPLTVVASPTNPTFRQNVARKPGSASSVAVASLDDNFVYQDEFVKKMEGVFAADRAAGRELFYSLDNEPGLWSNTHLLVHPQSTTYIEMGSRSLDYSTMIKSINPNAVVFGAVTYGWNEMINMQNSPEYSAQGDYLDYFLSLMARAQGSGPRLLDVLDIHWYTEATASNTPVSSENSTNPSADVIAVRVQSPRSLWDPTYVENSWISRWIASSPEYAGSYGGAVRLLPRMREKVATKYPGTKLAITEYNYGGAQHISGAIAQADVLGVFGREGVFAANYWNLTSNNNFVYAAFNMYLDYDGAGSSVGDIALAASSSDATGTSVVRTSVYAMAKTGDQNIIHVIAINKTSSAVPATIAVASDVQFGSAAVYQLTGLVAAPTAAASIPVQSNSFQYVMPAYSVTTLVLKR